MVVCFVDIGGIVGHHCLNFSFIINYKVLEWTPTNQNVKFSCSQAFRPCFLRKLHDFSIDTYPS